MEFVLACTVSNSQKNDNTPLVYFCIIELGSGQGFIESKMTNDVQISDTI